MPFGLHNIAQTIQRLMYEVLRGLPYVYTHMDDVLVASKDEESHKQNLHEVFIQLSHYGLHLNLDKCVFEVTSIEFQGHHANTDGINVNKTALMFHWDDKLLQAIHPKLFYYSPTFDEVTQEEE